MFVNQKENPQKPSTKVKRTKEEMQITLRTKRRLQQTPRNVLKRKNIVEEGGTLSSEMKREQESTNVKAQKMMRGRVEPFVVLVVLHAMPTMVQATKQTIEVPQLTFPQERQLKEQRQEVKGEHEIRFPKDEEHMHFDGDVYEDWMEATTSSQHSQHLQQQLQQQQ